MHRLKPIGLVFALCVVFAHYLWSASSTGNPFGFGEEKTDHYNLLADGLLAGELGFAARPSPEMLRLADPYDPKANGPYRVYHDVSLYRGRYYLYFGVAPALTLFIPFRLLLGMDLPEGFAVALLLFGGLVFSLLSFRLVLRQTQAQPGAAFLLVGIVLFGFSNFAPFVLRRPAVYEVAVSSGFFYSVGALYWLLRGIEGQRPRQVFLALASLFLSLAVGSRPHHVLAAPVLLAAFVYLVRRPEARPRATALSLGGPLTLCLASLLFYNYARFGAWFEFGQTYVLSDSNHPHLKLFSVSYVPSRLFLYFFAPPTLDLNFPFFHLWPSVMPRLPPQGIVLDSISGLLLCVPLAALSALSPVLLWLGTPRTHPPLPRMIAATLFAVGLVLVTFLSFSLSASARYFVDFMPLLLLSAGLVWSDLDQLCAGRRWARAALNTGLVLLLMHGTVLNLAVGLTGYYDLFRKRNLAGYAAIEDRFIPLQRWLLSLGSGYGDLRMLLRFPAHPPQTAEALLAVGEGEHADVLCVRYLEDGRAIFKFHHAADEPRRGSAFSVSSSQNRLLQVSMGSLFPRLNARVLSRIFPEARGEEPHRRLSIRLDGEEVIADTIDFVPGPVTIGANLRVRGHCPAAFSGQVLEIRRALPAFGGR